MTIPFYPQLPGLAYPIRRAPQWKTTVHPSLSGRDSRISHYAAPLYKWTVSYELLRADQAHLEWQTLTGLFNLCAGQALPFHWIDPSDNAALNQTLGVGDGATTTFYFARALGGFVDPLQDVIIAPSTPQVYSQTLPLAVRVAGTATTAFTPLTDPLWGLAQGITFTTPPAAGAAVSADFNFAWPCRFDADTADFDNFLFQFWEMKQLSFTSMRI